MIIQDTRQKKGKHKNIERYFITHNIIFENKKLDVGDYMLSTNKNVSVDTKYGMDELSTNLTNREDHKRFMAEIRRAYKSGIKLIILIEDGKIKDKNDVAGWRSKYTGVTGGRLLQEMFRLEMAYGVRFMFCEKRSCGRRIMEILTTGK